MKCTQCGCQFIAKRSRQILCSKKCQRMRASSLQRGKYAPKELKVKQCVVCESKFETKANNTLVCSEECARIKRIKIEHKKAVTKAKQLKFCVQEGDCTICGSSFIKERYNAKFCSKECREADHYIKHPKKHGELPRIKIKCARCKTEVLDAYKHQVYCTTCRFSVQGSRYMTVNPNINRDFLPPCTPRPDEAERMCLMCGKMFLSSDKSNRRCLGCQEDVDTYQDRHEDNYVF